MMPLQRACDAENQVRNKLSNGPRRAQSNGDSDSRVFCDVAGIRQLPGICWYPDKSTDDSVNSRWHRGESLVFVLDRKQDSVRGVFYFENADSSFNA